MSKTLWVGLPLLAIVLLQSPFAEIFKSKVSPAIAPENYKAPAVESLLHD